MIEAAVREAVARPRRRGGHNAFRVFSSWKTVRMPMRYGEHVMAARGAMDLGAYRDGCATMKIGYARVSTGEQDTAAQGAALKAAGCEIIFREKASGGRWDRPELHKLLGQLRKGDVLVVWKLDRLSRSLQDVLTIMDRVLEKEAGFRSLTEPIDTTTSAGRKDGRIGGRKPKLKPQQQQEILQLVRKGKKTAADAARLFGVHRATVTRLLHRKLAA
jgi:DNA invertase Pin-like site-specific DNA recombinase